MDVKFGTSGLRGLASDLLNGSAFLHVEAFVDHLLATGQVRPGDEVLVGRDLRESSPELARQCLAALSNRGMRPADCGALPTPALALLGLTRGQAAVMVTGSHIPADRNGIKFYSPTGEIAKPDEEAISAGLAATSARPVALEEKVEARNASQEGWAGYRERYWPLGVSRSLAGKRIGIFQHSSVARDFLDDLLNAFGAETIHLGRSEIFVPVDTEALDKDVQSALDKWAARHDLDAIVSTDADGDRPLVTDEEGRQIRGDVLGLITARFIGAGHVITPVTSSSGLEAAFSGHVVRTRVGSPYVIEAMQEIGGQAASAVAGFEANGGFLLGSPARLDAATLAPLPTRDAVLPILATLSALASGESLSRMVGALGLPVARSDRIKDYATRRSAALLAWLLETPGNMAAFVEGMGRLEAYDTIDGLRMTLEGGEIVHLRASGNAPEMRCYVEAGGDQRAGALLESGLERIEAFQPGT